MAASLYWCICTGIPVHLHGPRGLIKEKETMEEGIRDVSL
jgi:hypothetical protein